MSFYQLPDITGNNVDFLRVNVPFFIYEVGMKISFENSPVFEDSLKIALTDGTGDILTKGVDWVINSDDIDQTAMSRAYLENGTFNKKLLKSVTIFSNRALMKRVAMTFQQFYQTEPGRTGADDGRPLEVTPDLIKNLWGSVSDVKQQVANITSPVATGQFAPKVLPLDLNKERAGNAVKDEQVLVNTVDGIDVIRPTQGAFFGDSMVIKHNGRTLDPDKDYAAFVVSPLTKQSTNRSGIYQYVVIYATVVGPVTLDYHAVGGDVQPDDVTSIYNLMLSIRTFLTNSIFITEESVTRTPAFRATFARLVKLENQMRSLLNGNPTYGDASSNISVIRPVRTPDAQLHWWTIATLYKVQGSDDIITADQFKGRVHFPGAQVSLDFVADVNLNQTRNPVSFKTESLVFDPKYTLFGDVAVDAPVYPLVRVVWNQISQGYSGACIQIGLPLTSLTDRMVVEDLSTVESCWLLDKTGQFVKGDTQVNPSSPQDDGFVLPDGHSVWSSVSDASASQTYVPTFNKGYLVYAGSSVTLADITTSSATTSKFPVLLPYYFPLNNVETVLVTMTSADGSVAYDVEIPTPRYRQNIKAGRKDFITTGNDRLVMDVTLRYDITGKVIVALNTTVITAAAGTTTDVVKYIRVKV